MEKINSKNLDFLKSTKCANFENCKKTLLDENLVSPFQTSPDDLYCFGCLENFFKIVEHEYKYHKNKYFHSPFDLEKVKQRLEINPPHSILYIVKESKSEKKICS